MKVLITGVGGQLGVDIFNELNSRGIECVGTDTCDFDLTNEEQTVAFIKQLSPTAVVHCAAYTAVDNAQDEQEICMLVNAKGSENIAKACAQIDAKLLYISTDYVFDGNGTEPFEIDSKTQPLNVYGLSKLGGEKAVMQYCKNSFVLRTSWVFGKNGKNFVKSIIRIASQNDKISVVNDQIGSPTYTKDLAMLICDMINTSKYGIYHATNEGYCSFADFAEEIVKSCGYKTEVVLITSEELGAKAQRPKNSRLSKKSLDNAGFSRLPVWQDALSRYLIELNKD
ncbi:MAG: dTDP-4-dehydrorhamnose reductase [Clostridia bacterium]|nr:dTDP-4-dehydrorhamnose reductase [Clostridia bacterium]